jgi:hypothetical protein
MICGAKALNAQFAPLTTAGDSKELVSSAGVPLGPPNDKASGPFV